MRAAATFDLVMPFRTPIGKFSVRTFVAVVLAGTAMCGTAAGQLIDEHTRFSFDFATILAVGALAFPLVWKVSMSVQKMADKIEMLDSRGAKNQSLIENLNGNVSNLQQTVNGLWCKTHDQDCHNPARDKD